MLTELTHKIIRSFMRPGDPNPNKYYRPWLEQHVGHQYVDWHWKYDPMIDNTLVIYFKDSNHALLFELRW